ncbi:hypothetical protein D3C71_1318800 [compost metagenome]
MILALEHLPESRVAAGRHGNVGITQLPHAQPRPAPHLRARGARSAQRDDQVQPQRRHRILRALPLIADFNRQHGHRSRRHALAHITARQHLALLGGQHAGLETRQRAEQGTGGQAGRLLGARAVHHQQGGDIEVLAVDEPVHHLMHPAGLLIPVNQQSHSVGFHLSRSCVRASWATAPAWRTGSPPAAPMQRN